MKEFDYVDTHAYARRTLQYIMILYRATGSLDYYADTLIELATEQVLYEVYIAKTSNELISYQSDLLDFIHNASVSRDNIAVKLDKVLNKDLSLQELEQVIIENSQSIGILVLYELMNFDIIIDKGTLAEGKQWLRVDSYVDTVPQLRAISAGGTYTIDDNKILIKFLGTNLKDETYHFTLKTKIKKGNDIATYEVTMTDDLNRLPFLISAIKSNNLLYVNSLLDLLKRKLINIRETNTKIQK